VTQRGATPRATSAIDRSHHLFLWFLAPAATLLVLTQVIPLSYSAYLATINWSLAYSPTPGGFVGLANIISAFQDPVFTGALKFSAVYAVAVTAAELLGGFLLAFITRHGTPGQRLARVILTIPMAMASVAVAVLWRLLLSPQVGLVDQTLAFLHIAQVNWLGQPGPAIVALGWTDVWQWTPFAMLIYAAGLAAVPPELAQAASIDGASAWSQIRWVFLPLLQPMTVTILLFRLLDSFLTFDSAYALTDGGPGFSTTTASLDIFNQALNYFNISQAAAESWIVLVVALVVAVVLLRLRRRTWEA
jgi:multiple sugar transport system permease protein